ncbi:MAG: DUF5106 domain-containing protein [Bacteroidales bacterium]|nr:DUF5106 domain-containing protein [Bacteroidales bacterium]
MKTKLALFACFLLTAGLSQAQFTHYRFDFVMPPNASGRYYLAQHFQEKYIYIDSGLVFKSHVVFQGLDKNFPRGIYTLLDAKRNSVTDFVVDNDAVFLIAIDSTHSNKGMKVKGSNANSKMFAYLARQDEANQEALALKKQQENGSDTEKKEAQKRLDKLNVEMQDFETDFFKENKDNYFARVVEMTRMPSLPKDLVTNEEKIHYVRNHYWDNVDFNFPNLAHTAQFFNKMNYFFFGLLYYEESDTITKYANQVLRRVENDSAMLRYFLDFICPRYQKSTKHIGWDQVYVNLVKDYYLAGKCPWATEADLYNKRQEVEFLSQSLIGAHGAELWMADTNQSSDPKDWISSHRFPTKYVILWFWDPDCSHCQTQTRELKDLYNKMTSEANKRFEVYAVGYESDVPKWIKYVRDNQLPWVNVGGTNVNVDYQSVYNVHGAPTMIILNERRDIIMNKTLPISQLMDFLDKYEEKQKTIQK